MIQVKSYAEQINTQLRTPAFLRLIGLLVQEKKNLFVFLIYAAMISILYLMIPIAAQILVNIIAAGILLQPLVLISISVLVGLLFLGFLRVLQIYITEILQRKIFAQISLNIAEKIPKINQKNFGDVYAPELINRFFDTVTIQKTLASILLEIPAAVLQIITGIILMGFYSPLLLIFDTVLIFAIFSIAILGYKGLETSINESTAKYKVAYWLEEIARCHVGFKMFGRPSYLMEETDNRILDYLDNRKKHFTVLLRQFTAGFMIEAFASAGVLAIGGWLVLNGQLSLGQLVASELIILMILAALDKIIQKLESWYDLLTAIDKVSMIEDLGVERDNGTLARKSDKGAEVECEDIVFSYRADRKIFEKLNLKIEPGSRVSLVGVSGSGKTTLANLISGLYEVDEGNILFNGQAIKSLNLSNLRENIALVSDFNEIFSASVKENITLAREEIDQARLDDVVKLVELDRDLNQYEYGIETVLLSEGRNISLGQRQRILLARSLVNSPQLLILDEAFGGMDERTKMKIIKNIFDEKQAWTILNITHDAEVVAKTDHIYLLDKGKIVETGETKKLAVDPESAFSKLFPELYKMKIMEDKQ